MNRKIWALFLLKFNFIIILMSLFVSLGAVGAEKDAPPQDRPPYHELIGSWPEGEADIVEFFSYNCTYCYQAEKHIAYFMSKKPTSVSFQRYAVSSNRPGWKMSAAAFRAAHLGGIESTIGQKLFEEMNVKKQAFEDVANVRTFFNSAGVGDMANKYLESPESTALGTHIFKLAQNIQLTKTPTFVVKGKYIVYWGTHHTTESFTQLLLSILEKVKQTEGSCSINIEINKECKK